MTRRDYSSRLPALLLFCTLVVSACRTPEQVPPPAIEDSSTFLGLAALAVFELADPLERADLYTRLSFAYLALGDSESAQEVTARALANARSAGEGEESLAARATLVPALAELDPLLGTTVLRELLILLDERPDDVTRVVLIPLLTESVLASGESARFALRDAVDQAYIILDPAQRARTLIDVARLYQGSGEGLSVTALIQQAIPAVRSIAAPHQQIVFFADLARLAENAGELALTDRLIDMSLRTLSAAPPPSVVDQEALLAAVESFSALDEADGISVIEAIASLVPDGLYRVLVRAELAKHAESDEDAESALAELQLMIRQLGSLPERADATLGIAEVYAARGVSDTGQTNAVQELFVTETTLQADEERLNRLITLLVEEGRIEAITELLNAARDPYLRGIMAIQAADALLGQGQSTLASDFLTVGIVASDETTFLADALREQLVSRFARAGAVRLAIRTIERIDDPLFTARAAVALAEYAEPAGLMTPLLRADLASALQ